MNKLKGSAMLTFLMFLCITMPPIVICLEGIRLNLGSCVCVTENLVNAYSKPGYSSESITYLSPGECIRTKGQMMEMNGNTWYLVGVNSEETTYPQSLWVSGKFLKQANHTQCI